MMDYTKQLIQEIFRIIKDAGVEEDIKHSPNTRDWVLKIDPKASDELQIAALGHDIDRAVNPRILQGNDENYDSYKMRHAKRSAELIRDLMKKHNYELDSINHVYFLISNHEVGGDWEADILMDADSVSYFDVGIEIYYKKRGIEQTKAKIKFMYDRATPRAQKFIQLIEFNSQEINELCKEIF